MAALDRPIRTTIRRDEGGDVIEAYANLRLRFGAGDGPGNYLVTVGLDDEPPVESRFVLPMPLDAMRSEVAAIAVARSAATRVARVVDDEPSVDGTALGSLLADALFSPEVDALVAHARQQGRFRLALNLTDHPELLAIPWELLRRNGSDLASHPDTTIVRELDTAEPLVPQPVDGRLKMLVVIANPRNDLDVEGERRKITEAITGAGSPSATSGTDHSVNPDHSVNLDRSVDLDRDVDVTFLANCTYTQLQRTLQRDRFHILHFVGHSAATADGRTTLLLTGDDGAELAVDGNTIAQLVGGHRSLQLVVFNSCEGARTADDDAFTSFATMLVQQGLSAVIAMQFEIGDAAAKAFAGELYYSLIQLRYPIDAAVAEARKAIYPVSPAEFATPVLFLRSGRADLFDFAPAPIADPIPPTAVPRRTRPAWALPAAAVAAAVAAIGLFAALRPDTTAPADASAAAGSVPVQGLTDSVATDTTLDVDATLDAIEQCLLTTLFSTDSAADVYRTPVGDLFTLCDEALFQLDRLAPSGEELANAIDERLDDAERIVNSTAVTPEMADDWERDGTGLRERLLAELEALRAQSAAEGGE